jgi:hypothetical protein
MVGSEPDLRNKAHFLAKFLYFSPLSNNLCVQGRGIGEIRAILRLQPTLQWMSARATLLSTP